MSITVTAYTIAALVLATIATALLAFAALLDSRNAAWFGIATCIAAATVYIRGALSSVIGDVVEMEVRGALAQQRILGSVPRPRGTEKQRQTVDH